MINLSVLTGYETRSLPTANLVESNQFRVTVQCLRSDSSCFRHYNRSCFALLMALLCKSALGKYRIQKH